MSSPLDEAVARLAPVVTRTPLERNDRLSSLLHADVWLKREDLQVVRSYKARGAYNMIAALSPADRARGVVCASAGNHAQGVAFACRALGVGGRVFLPHTTSRQKIGRIAAIGGDAVAIVMAGDSFDETQISAVAAAAEIGAVVVPPFDHPDVIVGQATVAVEIIDQLGRPPDLLVVPTGGGGLLAGQLIATETLAPLTRVVGVEPAGAASMTAALVAGAPVTLDAIDTFVDGASVRRVGDLPFAVVQRRGARVVTVPEGQVCTAMLELYQSEGLVAEPAGALAVAALGDPVAVGPDETVVCIVSGGNNDVSRYGEIIERSLVHEGLKHYFLVRFPQEPGALRRFLDEVLGPDDDITLFEYVKKNNRETGPAVVGIELVRREDLAPLRARMEASPLTIEPIPPGSPMFAFLV